MLLECSRVSNGTRYKQSHQYKTRCNKTIEVQWSITIGKIRRDIKTGSEGGMEDCEKEHAHVHTNGTE